MNIPQQLTVGSVVQAVNQLTNVITNSNANDQTANNVAAVAFVLTSTVSLLNNTMFTVDAMVRVFLYIPLTNALIE